MLVIKQVSLQEGASWDGYVERHPHSTPYHLMAWRKSVEQAYSHRGVYFAAYDQGVLAGVLPLIDMSVPLVGRQLCSLPFCDLGGVLADSEQVRDALLEHLRQWLTREGFKSAALRHTATDEQEDSPPGEKVRMLLPLSATVDEQFNQFKSKLRSQIRKAEKNGVNFRVGNDKPARDGFYRVMQINMHQLGSPVHAKRWFDAVLDAYADKALLGLVEYEGTIIGGAILLFCGGTVTVPWASIMPQYNHLSPNMLLYWRLLSEAVERGHSRFDFGRSTVGEGTFKFKSQWGAKPVPLQWQTLTSDGLAAVRTGGGGGGLRDKVAEAWRLLPAPVANAIGPYLRRYISL